MSCALASLLVHPARSRVVEVERKDQLDRFLHDDAEHNHVVGFFHRSLHTGGETKLYEGFRKAGQADQSGHRYAISHSDDRSKRTAAELHYGTGPPTIIVVLPVGSGHYAHHKCQTRHEDEDTTSEDVMKAILACSHEGPEKWQAFRDRPPLHEMHDEL